VPVDDVIEELLVFPKVKVDYLTFSGRGEPTLAKNLGTMIRAVRKFREEKIAVITNSSLIDQPDVQEDLQSADVVMAKLDACSSGGFFRIDSPSEGVDFFAMVKGLCSFRSRFKGTLALQIMFMEQNKHCAVRIFEIARQISPDEVQLNTPTRPNAVRALSKEDMDDIKSCFRGIPTISVYDAELRDIEPIDLRATIRRHGNYFKGGTPDASHANHYHHHQT
jgi:wyosine [tRNA(Phe)-imidazoG37] synthetase (radical SAM superfamily)